MYKRQIQEITDALGDPYTYYMTAEEYQRFQDSLSDTAVVGIGVMAGYSKEGLVISGVAPDSPATQAGLRVGDAIVAVDGTTLEEAGSSEALALLVPGESGTDVQVTVLRDGQTFTATMTRAEVVFPTATGQVVDGHIGWLEVSSFGENTGDSVSYTHLDVYKRQNKDLAQFEKELMALIQKWDR